MSVLLQLPCFSNGVRNSRLEEFFRDGTNSDVRIKYNSEKILGLHKSYLRQYSDYFKDLFKVSADEYLVNMKYSLKDFEKVISCLYGYRHQIRREEVLNYFGLCKELKIHPLTDIIRKDVQDDFDKYNIFRIVDVFFQNREQELYNKGIKVLEQKGYQQLINQRDDVLRIEDIAAFRNLIKFLNIFKQKHSTQVSYLFINALIRQYCLNHQQKERPPEELYLEMRKELIDQEHLTSEEYHQIFFKPNDIKMGDKSRDLSTQKKRFAQTHIPQPPLNNSFLVNPRMVGSMYSPNQSMLNTENTYLKKKLKQLGHENTNLMEQFQAIKKQRAQDDSLRGEFQSMLKQTRSKGETETRVLSELDDRLGKLEQQLDAKDKMLQKQSEEIAKLKEELERLKRNPGILKQSSEEDEEVDDMIVQSTIIPHNYLKELMKPVAKEVKNSPKQQVQVDQDSSRLSFGSLSQVVPIKYHGKLLKIIDQDSFTTYNLQLLYRATEMGTRRQDFFERVGRNTNLLVLVKSGPKMFGGFVSVELDPEESRYIHDSKSYIFSINEGRKFKAKSQDPIFLSEEYFICFGSDIMIKQNCLISGGNCSWPSQYEGDKSLPSEWLCDSSFSIQQMEVYRIGTSEMEMTM